MLADSLTRKAASEKVSHAEYITLPLNDLFDEEPAPLDVFLYDKKFLALPPMSDEQFNFIRAGTNIYYENTIRDIGWNFDSYLNVLVALWGKGSGKDTVARIILSRIAYELAILKDPQRYLNIVPGDSINMLNIAFSSKQAQVIFFEPLVRILKRSTWFRSKIDPHEDFIRFPKEVNLYSGHSQQESLEGHNLIASVLDEIGAFKTKKELEQRQRRSIRTLQHSAEAIHDMCEESGRSRFHLLYKIIFISYPRYDGDYIMQMVEKYRGKAKAYVTGPKWPWEVNPTKTLEMYADALREKPEKSQAVYGCRPPKAMDAFFKWLQNTVEGKAVLESSFPACESPVSEDNKLLEGVRGIKGINYYAHVDLAISNDRAGVCVVHRAGFIEKVVTQIRDDGTEYKEIMRLAVVKVDLWTSFEAPPGGEIQLEDVRNLLFYMHDKRDFRLALMTFDGFQSADSIQQANKKGILSERLSVDKDTLVYDTFKDVLYGGRLKAYYREIGIEELKHLAIITGNRIDHQQGGSKDESDALAGAVYNAVEHGFDDVQVEDLEAGAPYSDVFGTVSSRKDGPWIDYHG